MEALRNLLKQLETPVLVRALKEMYQEIDMGGMPNWTVVEVYNEIANELRNRGLEIHAQKLGPEEWELVISGPDVDIPY